MGILGILSVIDVALTAAKAAGVGGDKIALAQALEKIVAGGLAAHKEATGQPLDINKLKPIELIP